jgi:hypothetical protein
VLHRKWQLRSDTPDLYGRGCFLARLMKTPRRMDSARGWTITWTRTGGEGDGAVSRPFKNAVKPARFLPKNK